MNSRERLRAAIHHNEPDRVPFDLGSTSVTGVHASTYAKIKKIYGITGGAVRVVDPYQMLAEVEEEVKGKLGIDTFGIQLPYTIFGFRNENWKPWKLFDGTDVLVSGHFTWDEDENGDILLYPQGDRSAAPSGRMAKNGYYFDAIVRQKPLNEKTLDPKKWVEQTLAAYTDEDMRYLEKTSIKYYNETEYGLLGNFCDGGLGDIGIVPGPNVRDPDGVRDPEEWYVSLLTRRQYIQDLFGLQTELAIKNLQKYREACGDRIDVIDVSETDLGGQRGMLISVDIFRELFKPFMMKINDWIHRNTKWKIFYHTCGSVHGLIGELVEIGVDILNPVQYSASGMDLAGLKKKWGDRLVFWGGGVDTQRILPFGTPGEIADEVRRNIETMAPGGGFVFSAVHNIQAGIPDDNLKALFDGLKSARCA